jgi:hypothetical protein
MNVNVPILNTIANKLCKHFGHHWSYKDYSNHITANGDKYDFRASRHCSRCGQNAYFYSEWKNENKAALDTESGYFSLRKIIINKIVYS